jgi:antitoxin HicB
LYIKAVVGFRSEVLERAMNSSDYEIELKVLSPEDGGGYLAWVPDLPGCMSDGATPDEATRNAHAAIEEWIAESIRLKRAVPAPSRKLAAF